MKRGGARVLRLSLLGEQRLSRRGTDLAAGGSRVVELLAYLVLHPGIRVPRAVLAGTFWPEPSQPQAMTNLRRELYNLRRLLGDIAVLEVSDGAIGVLPRAGLGVDVQLFSAERTAALQALAADDPAGFLVHARAALHQYRGDLMPGNYSDWVPEPRQRLLRECTDLCDQLVSVLRAQGQGQAALEVAGRRVAIAPLEEPGHRSLIRAHLALGDRPGALQAFHRCTELLERELGVAPAAETGRLVGSGPAPPTVRFPSRSTGPHGGRTPIGRQREMGVLRHCWQDACAGASGLLVLTGGPGVGKTHLAAALGDLVGSTGAVVTRARCVDSAGSIPLAPVAAWLRSREIATEISDAAIEVHARFGATLPTGHSSMHLYPIDGAAARVPPRCHGLRLPGRWLGGGACGCRPGSGQCGTDHRLDQVVP